MAAPAILLPRASRFLSTDTGIIPDNLEEGGAAMNYALGMKEDGKLDGALESVIL